MKQKDRKHIPKLNYFKTIQVKVSFIMRIYKVEIAYLDKWAIYLVSLFIVLEAP